MSDTRPSPSPLPRRSSRLPQVLILVATLWVAFGYLLAPWVIHRLAPSLVASALDARLEIRDLHFDPLALRLRMHDLRLTGPLSSPEFDARTLVDVTLLDIDLSLFSRRHLGPQVAVVVEGPRLAVERGATGSLDLAALLPAREPAAEPASGSGSGTTELELFLDVRDGSVSFLDRTRPGDFRAAVTAIDVQLASLSVPAGSAGDLQFGADLEGAHLDVRGRLGLAPEATLHLSLEGLPLALVDRWLADDTPLRGLGGALGLTADIDFRDDRLSLGTGRLTLDALRAASTAPLLADARLAHAAVDFDVTLRTRVDDDDDGSDGERMTLAAGAVRLEGLELSAAAPVAGRFSLERLDVEGIEGRPLDAALSIARIGVRAPALDVTWDGRIRPIGLAAAPGEDAGAPASPAPATTLDADIRIGAVEVSDLSLAATDTTLVTPASVRLDRGRITLGALRLPAAPTPQTTPFELELRALDSGTATFTGTLDPRPAMQGRMELENLDLTPLAPWVDAWSRLSLGGGGLTLGMDLSLAGNGVVDVAGDARVDDLLVRDPDGVALLALTSLDVRGITADTGSRAATVAHIALAKPKMRFARFANGSTNLSAIGPRAAAEDEGADEREEADTDTATAPWRWRIEHFELREGDLDFVDETLAIPFGTTVEALTADVDDISLDGGAPVPIHLEGRVPPNGTALIDATLSLPDPLERTRVDLTFERIAMPPLTPYVGTFAGRRVAGGRLDLDLDYRIDAHQLSAENRIVAQGLRLGPRMDSPSAMDLPLDLALALLRDSNDEILIDVPLSGNLDDPEFGISRVVMRAFGNIVTGLATAPFKLLTSLLPTGGPEIAEAEFDLGDAAIPEDQLDRFAALEAALNLRPTLALTVAPTHAGAADVGALRIDVLDARLAATGLEQDDALRDLFTETYGEKLIEALEAQYEAAGSSGGPLLGELRGRLLADISLPDDALEALARSRAQAIRKQLVATGLDEARIRISEDTREVEAAAGRLVMPFDLQVSGPPARP